MDYDKLNEDVSVDENIWVSMQIDKKKKVILTKYGH